MYIYMINLIYITAFQEKITATFMLTGVKAARVRTMGKKCSELSSDMWIEVLYNDLNNICIGDYRAAGRRGKFWKTPIL